MVLNMVRTIVSILVPLVTFPYVTRVLGVEGIGKVTFANSVIAYFIMLADLGVKLYAGGRGPAYRENKVEIQRFANSVYSINVVSTILSYLLIVVVILFTPQLHDYTLLLAILSLRVFMSTFSVDWLFTVYEDFKYITLCSIAVNIASAILLFLIVRTPDDVVNYAIIYVICASGAGLFSHFYSRKYIKVKFTIEFDLKKHIRPILYLFATQAAVFIYVNSDVTILGFLCGAAVVGIYTVAAKLYTVLKSLLAGVVTAAIPRMSSVYGKKIMKSFAE